MGQRGTWRASVILFGQQARFYRVVLPVVAVVLVTELEVGLTLTLTLTRNKTAEAAKRYQKVNSQVRGIELAFDLLDTLLPGGLEVSVPHPTAGQVPTGRIIGRTTVTTQGGALPPIYIEQRAIHPNKVWSETSVWVETSAILICLVTGARQSGHTWMSLAHVTQNP